MTEAEEIAKHIYDKYIAIRGLTTMKGARIVVWSLLPFAGVQMTDNIAEALLELCLASTGGIKDDLQENCTTAPENNI